MKELISKKARYEVAEHLSGFILREIHQECRSMDMSEDLSYEADCSGQRRRLARRYIFGLDLTKESDAKKFLGLCENLLNAAPPDSKFLLDLPKLLRRDGYTFEGGRIHPLGSLPSLVAVQAFAREFDAVHLQEQISRISSSIEPDPALAIGSAKELIETCCKTILAERGKPAKAPRTCLNW